MPVLTVHDETLVEADAAFAHQVGDLLADLMVEAFRDVLPNGPTRFLAIPGVGQTWAAAKADGEKREKALRQASPPASGPTTLIVPIVSTVPTAPTGMTG